MKNQKKYFRIIFAFIIMLLITSFINPIDALAIPAKKMKFNLHDIDDSLSGTLTITLIDKNGDGEYDYWISSGTMTVTVFGVTRKVSLRGGHPFYGIIMQNPGGGGFYLPNNLPNNLPEEQILSSANFRFQLDYNDIINTPAGDSITRVGFGFEVHNGIPDTLYGSFMKPLPLQSNTAGDTILTYYSNQSLTNLWNYGPVILNEPDTTTTPKISLNSKTENIFGILLNQANESITINDISEFNSIKIYNLEGNLIQSLFKDNIKNSINISTLLNGVYFLYMETNTRVICCKFIINR
jgi:hypothetical protein